MESGFAKEWVNSEYSIIDLQNKKSYVSGDLDTSYGRFIWDTLQKEEEKAEIDEILRGITFEDLLKAYEDVVKRKELKTDKVRSGFKAVEPDSFTIEEKIDYIHDMLEISPKVRFWDIFKEDTSKAEIVVTFMALLELIKTRKAEIKQEKIFGEITISRSNGCDNNEAL